jgi:hypothetical protein
MTIEASLLDNVGNKLKDFDVVAVASNSKGYNTCELGLYYKSCVFVKSNDRVIMKRYRLFTCDKHENEIDRQKVEFEGMKGKYKFKNIIQVINLEDDIMFFRSAIINMIDKGMIVEGNSRMYNSMLVEEAKRDGRI